MVLPAAKQTPRDLPDECPGGWACDKGLKRPLWCYVDSKVSQGDQECALEEGEGGKPRGAAGEGVLQMEGGGGHRQRSRPDTGLLREQHQRGIASEREEVAKLPEVSTPLPQAAQTPCHPSCPSPDTAATGSPSRVKLARGVNMPRPRFSLKEPDQPDSGFLSGEGGREGGFLAHPWLYHGLGGNRGCCCHTPQNLAPSHRAGTGLLGCGSSLSSSNCIVVTGAAKLSPWVTPMSAEAQGLLQEMECFVYSAPSSGS